MVKAQDSQARTLKIIWMFLFLQPFLDVFTSFAQHYVGHSSYFALGIKVLFLFYLFWLCMKKHDKKLVTYVFLVGIYLFLFMGLQFLMKGSSFLFLEGQSLFRTFYFPLVFTFLMVLYRQGILKIENRYLVFILLLYLSFLIFPTIAKVGFDSYAHSKVGNIGWFYSTNEIGGILAILGPFFLFFLMKQKWWIRIIGLLFYLLGIFILGTKVPVLSLIIIILCFVFVFFLNLFLKKEWKKLLLSSIGSGVCLVLFSFLVFQSSFYKNIQIHLDFLGIQKVQDLLTFHHIDHFIFSERLSFLCNTHEIYTNVNLPMKIIGMGVGDMSVNSPQSMKMIEMDYFDIIYHYGVLGTLMFVLPFFWFYKKRKYLLSEKISLLLILLLAFFSGHILVSPSVSVLVSLVIIPKEEQVV